MINYRKMAMRKICNMFNFYLPKNAKNVIKAQVFNKKCEFYTKITENCRKISNFIS